MKIDRLLSIAAPASVETDDTTRQVLYRMAYSFVSAGGVISLSEWAELSVESRAALIEASDDLARERAALIGVACQGVDGVASVMEKVDRGEYKIRLALERVALKAQMRLEGKL